MKTSNTPENGTEKRNHEIDYGKKDLIINTWLLDDELHYSEIAKVAQCSDEYARRIVRKLEANKIEPKEYRDEPLMEQVRSRADELGLLETGESEPINIDFDAEQPFESTVLTQKEALGQLYLANPELHYKDAKRIIGCSGEYARQIFKALRNEEFDPDPIPTVQAQLESFLENPLNYLSTEQAKTLVNTWLLDQPVDSAVAANLSGVSEDRVEEVFRVLEELPEDEIETWRDVERQEELRAKLKRTAAKPSAMKESHRAHPTRNTQPTRNRSQPRPANVIAEETARPTITVAVSEIEELKELLELIREDAEHEVRVNDSEYASGKKFVVEKISSKLDEILEDST